MHTYFLTFHKTIESYVFIGFMLTFYPKAKSLQKIHKMTYAYLLSQGQIPSTNPQNDIGLCLPSIQGFQSGPVPGTFTRLRSCIVPAEITEPPQISGGQNHKYDRLVEYFS